MLLVTRYPVQLYETQAVKNTYGFHDDAWRNSNQVKIHNGPVFGYFQLLNRSVEVWVVKLELFQHKALPQGNVAYFTVRLPTMNLRIQYLPLFGYRRANQVFWLFYNYGFCNTERHKGKTNPFYCAVGPEKYLWGKQWTSIIWVYTMRMMFIVFLLLSHFCGFWVFQIFILLKNT